jgi:uncharacterized protein YdhG (YjbR/CyaY superfamily)
MQRSDAVTAYIGAAPQEHRASLETLRELCLTTLVGHEEVLAYGMPGYQRGGVVEVSFASRKRYVALYIQNVEVMAAHQEALEGLDVGKGCIRYPRPEAMDFGVIARLLADTRASPQGIW